MDKPYRSDDLVLHEHLSPQPRSTVTMMSADGKCKCSLHHITNSSPSRHGRLGKLGRASSVLLHLDMENHDNEAPVKTEGDHISEAKLVRKIDGRVLPVLCAITLLSFLDR